MRRRDFLMFLAMTFWLAGCGSKPAVPATEDAVADLPASLAVNDGRKAFWQLFCQLNQQYGADTPAYRPCQESLLIPPGEALLAKTPIDYSVPRLANVAIVLVPGLGWDCIAEFVGGTAGQKHLSSLGYRATSPEIEGLSSSGRNAQLIYRHMIRNQLLENDRKLIFIGYSKGLPDVLEALVAFPRIQQQTLAVVSVAGAVWGTPLADTTPDLLLDAYNLVPGKDCVTADHGALESLKPAVRRQWFADNPLPQGTRYYSVVSLPGEEHISNALKPSYKILSKTDARNDSQLIYSDQIIPGSTLLAYIKADHLAVAVPIVRDHQWLGRLGLDKNDYPRDLLLEAVLRQVEADILAQEQH